jgi:hypothetical protein
MPVTRSSKGREEAIHHGLLDHQVKHIHDRVEEQGERGSPCLKPPRLKMSVPAAPLTTTRVEAVPIKPQTILGGILLDACERFGIGSKTKGRR